MSLDCLPQCHYVPSTKPSGAIPLDVLEEECLRIKEGLCEDLHQVAATRGGGHEQRMRGDGVIEQVGEGVMKKGGTDIV